MSKVTSNMSKNFKQKRGLRGDTYQGRTDAYNQTDVSESVEMAQGGSIFDRQGQLDDQERAAGIQDPVAQPPVVSPLPVDQPSAPASNIISQGIDAAYQGFRGFNDALSKKLGDWGFASGGGLRGGNVPPYGPEPKPEWPIPWHPKDPMLADGGRKAPHEGPGLVVGPGGPREDKVDAKYSAGEYVLPAKTVAAMGGAAALDQVVMETNDGRKPVGSDGRAQGPIRAASGLSPDDLDHIFNPDGSVTQTKEAMRAQLATEYEGAPPRLPAQASIEAAARRPVPAPVGLETDAAAANRIAATNAAPSAPLRAPNLTTGQGAVPEGSIPYTRGGVPPQAPEWTTSAGAGGPPAGTPPSAPAGAAGEPVSRGRAAMQSAQSVAAQAAEKGRGILRTAGDMAKAAPKKVGGLALRTAAPIAIGAGITSIPESMRTSTEDMAAENSNIGGQLWTPQEDGRSYGSRVLSALPVVGPVLGRAAGELIDRNQDVNKVMADSGNRTAGTLRRFANAGTAGYSEKAAVAMGANPLTGAAPEQAPVAPAQAPEVAPQEAAQPEDPFMAQAAGDRLADRSVAALRRGPTGEALPTQANADMLSQAQAFRGSPIRANIGENGNMEFSGQGPSNRVYTGVDGRPVTRYEDSAQFAEGTQRARGEAQQLDDLIRARLASGNRDDIEQANRLAVTPEQKAMVNAAYGAKTEAARREKLPLRERVALGQQDVARENNRATLGLRAQEMANTERHQRTSERLQAATLQANDRNRQEDNARADTAAAEARDTKVGGETDEFIKGAFTKPDASGKAGPDTEKQEAFRRYLSLAGEDIGKGETRAKRDVARASLRTAFDVQNAIDETGGMFGATEGEGPDPIMEVREVRASDIVNGGTAASKYLKSQLPWTNDRVVVTKSGQVRRVADIAIGPDGKYNKERLAYIARAAKVPQKDLDALDKFQFSR